MRMRPTSAILLAAMLAAAAIPMARAADPPQATYRLEPRKVADIPDGKAVLVNGKAGKQPHRFYLEHMHMMLPVVVTLRPLSPDAEIDLAIGKYPWEPPLKQGTAQGGKQVSFRFRTEGEFQVAVSSATPDTPYKLLVWVGDEVKPELKPIIVPQSQFDGAGGGSRWTLLAGIGVAVLVLTALLVFFLRRKRA